MDNPFDLGSISSINQQCTFCSKIVQEIEKSSIINLSCNKHFLCSRDCANEFTNTCTENNILNWETTECFICSIPLSKDFYKTIYGESFEEMLKKAHDASEPKFTCTICHDTYKISDSITLPCDHRYCKNCFKKYLENKINEAKVNKEDLSCPENGCLAIDINYIKNIVDAEVFNKYEYFSMERWTPELKSGEIFYSCNGVNCCFKIVLDESIEEFKCPKCEKTGCPKCKEEVHKSLTCEENKKKKKDALDEEEFNNVLKVSGFIRCPWCGNGIEKISGCKFLTCSSSQCKEQKKFLCFDCRNGLSQDHQVHNCIRSN